MHCFQSRPTVGSGTPPDRFAKSALVNISTVIALRSRATSRFCLSRTDVAYNLKRGVQLTDKIYSLGFGSALTVSIKISSFSRDQSLSLDLHEYLEIVHLRLQVSTIVNRAASRTSGRDRWSADLNDVSGTEIFQFWDEATIY